MSKFAIFTIANSNECGAALSFFESLTKLKPKVDQLLFLSDVNTSDKEISSISIIKQLYSYGVEVIGTTELDLDPGKAACNKLLSSPDEFKNFLKPFCFSHLLKKYSWAVYVDVFSYFIGHDLSEIKKLHNADALLLPRDFLDVSQLNEKYFKLLSEGIYSSKFIGFSQSGIAAVGYLSAKYDQCDPKSLANENLEYKDLNITQDSWLNFLPGFCKAHLIKTPGTFVEINDFNQNELLSENNDKELCFINYAGIVNDSLSILRDDTNQVSEMALLITDLVKRYKTTAPIVSNELKYDLKKIVNSNFVKQLYKQHWLLSSQGLVPEPPNPCLEGEECLFLDWLFEKDSDLNLTRALAYCYKTRHDLNEAFEEVKLGRNERFLNWVKTHGINEGIPAELSNNDYRETTQFVQVPSKSSLRGLMVTLPHSVFQRLSKPGINVFGYLKSVLGVGEEARTTVDCIKSAGIPFKAFNIFQAHLTQKVAFDDWGDNEIFNVNYFHINADQLPIIIRDLGPYISSNRYNIGVWAWEISDFPKQYLESIAYLDELWTVSEFTKAALTRVIDRPVFVRPVLIRHATSHKPFNLQPYNLDGRFVFLFSFDFNSIFERKNPLDLVRAYKLAFKESDQAALIIKSVNGKSCPLEKELLLTEIGLRKDIVLIDEPFDQDTINALMEAVDAYVSFHRAEGFGLSLAEAMLIGKPVVATAYSGNLDFMNNDNSLLIPYELIELDRNYGPYSAGCYWAQPNIYEGAKLMRLLYDNQDFAKQLGKKARDSILSLMARNPRSEFIRKRFVSIQNSLKDFT